MKEIKIENYSWILYFIIAVVLFNGEPNIADALREAALKWSGLK